MSQPLYPPARAQSIGQVLDAGFRIFQVSLAKCLPYGVLSMIAGQLANIYYLAIGKPMQPFGGGDPLWWVLYAIGTLGSLTLWSAMLLRQLNIVTQQPTHARAELLGALRRVPALIGAGVLTALIIAGGLIAFVVPGLYFATAMTLVWPALLFERLGPIDAIHSSVKLVRGAWWRASAVLVVAFVVAMVFYIVVFALMAIALPLAGANDVAMFTAASVVVVIALGAIGVPFYGAILLALYGDLILRREGADRAMRLAGVTQG